MNPHVERLTRLVAPPDVPPLHKDWDGVISELGTGLPGDYVDLIDTYGGGRFDGYLWFLEPRCANRHYDLERSISERNGAFQMLWEMGEPKPEQLESSGSQVIPWASTDNGEFLYWLVRPGVDPDEWTIMVNEARGEWWEQFEVGCSELLVRLLAGEIRSEILSSSFPPRVHEFRSSASF